MWLQIGIASDGRATTVKKYSQTNEMKQGEAARDRKFPGNERRGEQRQVVHLAHVAHVSHDSCISHGVIDFLGGCWWDFVLYSLSSFLNDSLYTLCYRGSNF